MHSFKANSFYLYICPGIMSTDVSIRENFDGITFTQVV